MSLAKVVPEGIRDKECERFALQERPPVPSMLEKESHLRNGFCSQK
jgi:hypothetical protein